MSSNYNQWNRPPPAAGNQYPQFDRRVLPPPLSSNGAPVGSLQNVDDWNANQYISYPMMPPQPNYFINHPNPCPGPPFEVNQFQNRAVPVANNVYHGMPSSSCNSVTGLNNVLKEAPLPQKQNKTSNLTDKSSEPRSKPAFNSHHHSRDSYQKGSYHRRTSAKEEDRNSSYHKSSYKRKIDDHQSFPTKDSKKQEYSSRKQSHSRYHQDDSKSFSRYSSKCSSSKYHQSNPDSTDSKISKLPNISQKRRYDYLSSDSDEDKLTEMDEEEVDGTVWTRSSPADLYYQIKNLNDTRIRAASKKLMVLLDKFDDELVQRGRRIRAEKPKFERKISRTNICQKSNHDNDSSSSSNSSSDDSSDNDENSEINAMAEMELKKKHPDRLHDELWYNDPGEMNDGPLCRCSLKASRSGIRHSLYPGEGHLMKCNPYSNNANRLHHYRITMSPHTNFVTKKPTIIKHDGHEFIFEGFSLFSHTKLKQNLPQCKVIRFNIEYTILYLEEKFPENFTVQGLELFNEFLFKEVLELVDLDLKAHSDSDGCPQFHLMPRFVRSLEDNGKEILSMNQVLQYFLNSNEVLVDESQLNHFQKLSTYDWQKFTDKIKGMVVNFPGKKPCSLRVDQLDRELEDPKVITFPEIVHFGIRPPQLSYAGSPSYQKAWREYVKFRHLLANKPKVSSADRSKLQQKEIILQDMRTKNNLKRDVTVAVSSEGFYTTGIMCDIVQHAMLIPVLICHLRFHKSLDTLEEKLGYKFKDRFSLQLALTHPSYRENFGTNPDHARNSLTNCGIRQPEYGDRRIHFMNTRKRGISTLINIMSRFGQNVETASSINHNERLEFLGDAVVEFITSIHLFHMFPDLEEGGLATYRTAIVQNQHLAVLAKQLELEKYMLFAHGSDLCHDLELRHAMANCFEAVMGALFLDGGIEVSDKVFAETLFQDPELQSIWVNYPLHVLQEQEPHGDRKWIDSVPILQKLTKFENDIGVEFTHIRLLARSFTMRSLGYNHLTLGSNQRLEFLGDTVLQLIASEYLYKHFPEHHEGHLSLLRSSLVNNRTQSVVCEDVGMVEYAINSSPKLELKTKDKADLLEAFLGALYVDKGLENCKVFCQVCFFPRLQDFILNQDWNDPKSKLQQCCLTLRSMDGGEPDIPLYKVIETKGPTNTRIYIVAVYFRGKRLSKGSGHSIQQAEMDAANNALASSKELFPQLIHQRRVIEKSMCYVK